jgi:hypothetical protein
MVASDQQIHLSISVNVATGPQVVSHELTLGEPKPSTRVALYRMSASCWQRRSQVQGDPASVLNTTLTIGSIRTEHDVRTAVSIDVSRPCRSPSNPCPRSTARDDHGGIGQADPTGRGCEVDGWVGVATIRIATVCVTTICIATSVRASCVVGGCRSGVVIGKRRAVFAGFGIGLIGNTAV